MKNILPKGKKILLIILFLILLTSLLLRVCPLTYSHWWDEAVYLQNSETIFSGRVNYDEFHLRPPLLSILFAFGYLFKHHIFTAGIITALLGTLGVLFTYLIGREIYNKKTGLIAATLLAFSPFLVKASHWIMSSIPSITFLIISFYTLIRATKKQSKWLYFLSGIFFTISILTRFTSLILLFIIPIYIYLHKIKIKEIKPFIYGLIISMLPYLIWVQIKYGFFLRTFISANYAVSDKVGNIFYYLIHFKEVYPLIIIIGLIPIPLIIIRRFYKEKSIKNFNKLELVLLSWGIFFLIYISITPHKEPRYILPILLPVVLLSARGYDLTLNIKNKLIPILIIILAITSFYPSFLNLGEPLVNMQKSTEVEVSEYLLSLNTPEKTIYSNHNYPVFAYYTNMETIIVKYNQEFYDEYPNNMKNLGYFIHYKKIPKEPNQEWLDSQKEFIKLKEINNILIYKYEPKI